MRRCHCQKVVMADHEDSPGTEFEDAARESLCHACALHDCLTDPNGCLAGVAFASGDSPRLGLSDSQWIRYDENVSLGDLSDFVRREQSRRIYDDLEFGSEALRSHLDDKCSHSSFEIMPGDVMVEIDGEVSGYGAADFDAAFPEPSEWEVEAVPVTASGQAWAARPVRRAFDDAMLARSGGPNHLSWLCEVCLIDADSPSPCDHYDPVVEVVVKRRPVWRYGGMIVKPEAWESKAVAVQREGC